jgi:hypothetical protein
MELHVRTMFDITGLRFLNTGKYIAAGIISGKIKIL